MFKDMLKDVLAQVGVTLTEGELERVYLIRLWKYAVSSIEVQGEYCPSIVAKCMSAGAKVQISPEGHIHANFDKVHIALL